MITGFKAYCMDRWDFFEGFLKRGEIATPHSIAKIAVGYWKNETLGEKEKYERLAFEMLDYMAIEKELDRVNEKLNRNSWKNYMEDCAMEKHEEKPIYKQKEEPIQRIIRVPHLNLTFYDPPLSSTQDNDGFEDV